MEFTSSQMEAAQAWRPYMSSLGTATQPLLHRRGVQISLEHGLQFIYDVVFKEISNQ